MEQTNKPDKIDDSTAPGQEEHNFRHFLSQLKNFLVGVVAITEGTDVQGTVAGIKKDVSFRGHSAWILMFSVFIASIGLNVNSTAVVIGAMLISPLMGPILGIGLSVGTNDWDTLVRSLKNFAIMIVIGLLTSTLYFFITPLKEVQAELLARTKPTSLDVLIALFGGFAGIIAGSRREKSNVIPGVAIATALMPPLCTAGYGLATGNLNFFFGAFYLFFINSVFISIATLITVRALHFPKINFLDHDRERRIKRYILIFTIIVILPSAFIFWNVVKEARFKAAAIVYIEDNFKFETSEVINKTITYSDTLSRIDVYVIGDEIPQKTIEDLRLKMYDYGLVQKGGFWQSKVLGMTDNTMLKIHQSRNNTDELMEEINYLSNNLGEQVRTGIIEDLFERNERLLEIKSKEIDSLQKIIHQTSKDTIPFNDIKAELKVQFERLEKVAYAPVIESHFADSVMIDTIPTFLVEWNRNTWRSLKRENEAKMANWLKVRLKLDTVRVIEY